jgi:hypothetical protein
MAKIVKTITGLKPDQDYLVTLRVKNTEISAIDDPYESIRIHTPKDQTIPGAIDINTFYIYGNYKSVMFQFEPTVELDVNGYKYELYSDALGTTLISSGIATATVFSIDVPDNSNAANPDTAQTDVIYYGRVKTIDTSGNESGWTPSSGLKASTATDMIQGSHIINLTAAKITAGTIGAHEIILKQQGAQSNIVAPANMAIIRSSNYNGAYNNNTGVWTSGTTGWVISGDGRAEFSTASIRGTLKAGSVYIDANNRWKSDTAGNTISTSEFRVGNVDNFIYWDGSESFSVKGSIQATSGKIAGWDISGSNLISGAGYNGSMAIGPGRGPASVETGGPTGGIYVDAGVSPGYVAVGEYNAYYAKWARAGSGPDFALSVQPDGISYQFSETDKFEFRLISGAPYIVINGTQYALTIGGGSSSGGGSGGGAGGGGGGTTDPPPATCTTGTVMNGSCCGCGPCLSYTTTYADCSTNTFCDGPNCECCGIIVV